MTGKTSKKLIKRKPKIVDTSPYKCEYCTNKYKTENTFVRHKCKGKLRIEEYHTPGGRIGFIVYRHFYSRYTTATQKKDKNLIDYIKCRYYNSFYAFGNYVVNNQILHYMEYVDFLCNYNIALSEWTNDQVYNTYIKGVSKKESPISAVERGIETMKSWAKRNNADWREYFNLEETFKVIHAVHMGKISPWILYNSSSAIGFIESLDYDTLDKLYKDIDIDFWLSKFVRYREEKNIVKETLQHAGL